MKIFAFIIAAIMFAFVPQAAAVQAKLATPGIYETGDIGVNDWYVIAMSRTGVEYDYNSYLKQIERRIKESDGVFSKATDFHRTILAVKACGGDPSDIAGINLIKQGITDNESIARQGINGYIWGLIALGDYKTGKDELNTAEKMKDQIIAHQLSDGGFALSGNDSDVDITAMAVTALAPYRDDGEIAAVIENALEMLSKSQLPDGGFENSGDENSESISQVIVALSSAGINPDSDKRFIKNSKTLTQSLSEYKNGDGFYAHIKNSQSNGIASAQAVCALAAVDCLKNNKGTLYSFENNVPNQSKPPYLAYSAAVILAAFAAGLVIIKKRRVR